MTDKPSHAYVGRKPCGCVAWICSTRMAVKELANELFEADRQGLTVELMPTQEAVDAFSRSCHHGDNKLIDNLDVFVEAVRNA